MCIRDRPNTVNEPSEPNTVNEPPEPNAVNEPSEPNAVNGTSEPISDPAVNGISASDTSVYEDPEIDFGPPPKKRKTDNSIVYEILDESDTDNTPKSDDIVDIDAKEK